MSLVCGGKQGRMRSIPPIDLPGGSKTMAVSPYGNVVMVNQDYELLYSDLRNEGSTRAPQELPVDCSGWDREFKDAKFNNIEFNSEGNILLVWSKNSIGFLAIPTKNAPDGSFDASMMAINPCPFCELLSDNDVVRDGSVKVLKVAFHPLSNYHVVILLSNNTLLLTDTLSDVSREFPLRLSMLSSPVKKSTRGGGDGSPQFVSFCFGGDYDWMKLAVLLLTADGHVFFLCPLLPSGAVVPKTTIDSLYSWVEEEGTPKGFSGATSSHIARELLKYLDTLFRPGGDRAAIGGFNNEIGEFVGAMDGLGAADTSVALSDIRSANVVVEASDDILWEDFSPLLQGPLPVQASDSGASEAACDICVPQRCRAPVILVAYMNGSVEMLTAQEGSAAAFMRPMWPAMSTMLGGSSDNDTRYIPRMQLLERIYVPPSVSQTPRWSLSSDPVHSHYFHLSDGPSGAVYLIMCNWLNKVLLRVDEATGDALSGTAIENGDGGEDEDDGDLAPSSVCTLMEAVSSGGAIDRHCGASVVSDAMLGHIAIHRTSEGAITTTNITTTARLYQYQELVEASSVAREGKSKTSADAAGGDGENAALRRGVAGTNIDYDGLGRGSFEKRARLLTETVKKGLETVPMPPAEDDYDDTLEATKKKHLLAASKHLNQHAILPLEDLAHRIVSALDGVRDIYSDQMRFLEGPKGFKQKLWELHHHRKAELSSRIEAIGTRLLDQRTRSKELLARYATLNARKATVQETEYARQLDQWRTQLGTMQSQLTSLGGMVKVCTGEVLLHADGRAASKGSFRASRGGVDASPSSFSHLSSPSAATAPSMASPSPVRTETSSMFQSPRQAPQDTSTATTGSGAGRKQTPLERRRRGGGGLGSANVSRLTNRMSSLNVSTTGAGAAGTPSSSSKLGQTFSMASATGAGAGEAGLNVSAILSSGAYERALSSEEASYADDLIKSQSKTIADSERKAYELEQLVSELREQMKGRRG